MIEDRIVGFEVKTEGIKFRFYGGMTDDQR